jgi:hypothetical protein
MPSIVITRQIHIPTVGTWKWTKADYDVPLVFQLSGVKALLKLDNFNSGYIRDREIIWQANLSLEFTNPTPEFIRGLETAGKLAQETSETIFGYYLELQEMFEGLLRTVGGVNSLIPEAPMSIDSFFEKESIERHGCHWCVPGTKPVPFNPKLSNKRKRINPLFRGEQILTKLKWKRLQVAIHNQNFPTPELLELLRIRANLQWRDNKIPTIEAAILVETILREYAEKSLVDRGFSKSRVKALRDDLSFNTFLNIVLPLSLTKAESKKIESNIRKVDTLRRIRNDIVHGNITAAEINEANVRAGIEGALAVVAFVRKKLGSA